MLKLLKIIIILALPLYSIANTGINDNKEKLGTGSLYVFMWHIYDATLYTTNVDFSFDEPFNLSLTYYVNATAKEITKETIKQMKKLGFKDESKLEEWKIQMENAFPDVKKGDTVTGLYTPNQATVFYLEDNKVGTIDDPEFGKWFFGIWLDEKTSEPKLRKKLLGIK